VQFLEANWLKLLIFALIALMVIWAVVRDRKPSRIALSRRRNKSRTINLCTETPPWRQCNESLHLHAIVQGGCGPSEKHSSRKSTPAAQSTRPRALAKRPSAKYCKPVSALPPQMSPMLIWPIFSSVARPLLSHGLVVGQHPQNTLVRPLVHGSGLDWHGAAPSPLEPSSQFFYTTRRTVPAMAHRGLIGDASAFATTEKPDAVIGIASIEDAR
jgi:hypothetical protein